RARTPVVHATGGRSLDVPRAVQRLRLPLLGGADPARAAAERSARARASTGELGGDPGRGADAAAGGAHPQAREARRSRVQLVLQARLAAFLPEVVRRLHALGAGPLSAHARAARRDALGARSDVRRSGAAQPPGAAPRSVRRLAAVSPRPADSQPL